MLLFRYFGSHGYETLRDRLLKVSKVSAFNDPFECAYRLCGEPTMATCRRHIRSRLNTPEFVQKILQLEPRLKTPKGAQRHVKANLDYWAAHFMRNTPAVKRGLHERRESMMDENMRVVSFSSCEVSPTDEILIWSHYSAKHAGLRIGFEIPELPSRYAIRPMIYQDERVALDLAAYAFAPQQKEIMGEVMRTKSSVWKYECEHRLTTVSSLCAQKTIGSELFEFLQFDASWVKRVDFGIRHGKSDRARVMELLRSDFPTVECFQAVLHNDLFALGYEAVR